MNWETYERTYRDYTTAASQIEILTIVSNESLKDFPANLPEHLRETLAAGLIEVAGALREVAKSALDGHVAKRTVDPREDHANNSLFNSVLKAYLSGASRSDGGFDSSFELNFERLLSSQALIMVFAYLDAFLGDTLRVICSIRPEVLKTDKKMNWSKALEFERRDDLIRHLTERYVYDFGWLTLLDRIDYLKAKLGLAINPPSPDVALLQMGENVRHVAVHNGGRASQEYLAKTGRTDLSVGELVPLTFNEVDRISNAASLLAADIFEAVSEKFFDRTGDELGAVMLRAKEIPPKQLTIQTPGQKN